MLNMATTVPLPATVVMMPAGRHLPDSVVAGVRDKEIPFGERTTGIQTTKTRQSAILNNTGNQWAFIVAYEEGLRLLACSLVLPRLIRYRSKMPQHELQCPFCEQTSSRSQGLAAHIRSRHPKQYPKWLKTPSRLADASKGAVAPEAATQPPAKQPEPPAISQAIQAEAPVSALPAVEANPALDLLKKAHGQLVERKQSIEAELSRLTGLTKELETINTQIQALDKTLGVFESRTTS